MKKLLGILAVLYVGVSLAANIQFGYTAKVYVGTNGDTNVVFWPGSAMVDLSNKSANEIQFALNCDAVGFTNLYTNNICGILTSGETKRIQIANYPISSVWLHTTNGGSNLVYVTGI